MSDGSESELIQSAFLAFVDTPSWRESRDVLGAYPELISDRATDTIKVLVAQASANGPEEIAAEYSRHAALLRRCREIGIDAAFREIEEQPTDLLPDPHRRFLHALRLVDPPGSAIDREGALDAAREVLGSLTPTSVLLDLMAEALLEGYEKSGSVEQLDSALSCWNEALALTPKETPDHLRILSNRSQGLRESSQRLGSERDLGASLDSMAEALLAAPTGDPNRAMYLSNRAIDLMLRYQTTGDLADLEAAISACVEAVDLTSQGDPDRLIYLNNLAAGLAERYERLGSPDDLDSALDITGECLELLPRRSDLRPRCLGNRANHLVRRYQRTGKMGDLDQALAAIEEALALTPERSLASVSMFTNRARFLALRFDRTRDLSDLDRAILAFDAALSLTAEEDTRRAGRLGDRATCLRRRFAHTKDATDLTRALEDVDEALRSIPLASPDRLAMVNTAANCFFDLYGETGDAGELNRAIETWQEAVRLLKADSPYRPGCLSNLGTALLRRYRVEGRPDDLCDGVSTLREACTIGLRKHPETTVAAARAWAESATERSSWEEASEAGAFGLEAADGLIAIQASREAKASRVRDVQGLGGMTAYAWARRGAPRQAVVAAERGRTAIAAEASAARGMLDLLTSAGHDDLVRSYERAVAAESPELIAEHGELISRVALDQRIPRQPTVEEAVEAIRRVSGFQSFLARQTDDEILRQVVAAASEGPLVYLIAAPAGGLALKVAHSGDIQFAWLPELSRSATNEKASEYLGGYEDAISDPLTFTHRLEALDQITAWLSVALAQPLASLCCSMAAGKITLVPLGVLGLLPLHAAWQPSSKDTPTGRWYLLDEAALAYAPSARLLAAARPPSSSGTDRFLAIEEPQSTAGARLPGARGEVAAAASWFAQDSTILSHEYATKTNVLAALHGYPVIHFACHGLAQPGDPLQSSLLMAHDERITLLDILDHRLEGARLVVLSACETAFPGTELLDEVVSLPTGLLQAGAAAVIASLWPVDDLATMVLFSRFYELWRGKGLTLAEALRGAQLWLRDLTATNRAMAFPQVDFGRSGSPGPRPYAHPYWWAPFQLTGS